jgi:type IV secretion system protein VirB11
MLRTAVRPAIAGWLEDPAIAEIMLTPEGRLCVDHFAEGFADARKRLLAEDGERVDCAIAVSKFTDSAIASSA